MAAEPPQVVVKVDLTSTIGTPSQYSSVAFLTDRVLLISSGKSSPTSVLYDIVDRKGIFVIPDILANAGGVTVSYFEWVQDRQGYFWSEREVNERLKDVIDRSFEEVVKYAELHGVNNRIAAYMLAIDRVAYALKERGIYA